MNNKLLKTQTLLFLFFLLSTVSIAQNNEYNIKSFGAVADGVSNNAVAIQKAIDEANKNGGGKVTVPPGNFVTGAIVLKSGVQLYIELGARLIGSDKIADYENPIALALIVAKGQQNISISGKGVIDGRSGDLIQNIFEKLQDGTIHDRSWKNKRPSEDIRPKLIEIVECDQVEIRDVMLRDPASWTQNYVKCSNLVIDNIIVQSTAYHNNDGLNINSCKHVKITNCDINSSDDGICLKSEEPNVINEDIYVADCKIRTNASAFKLGASSLGGFKNIKVRNLTIYDTYRSAIALESVDGGILEDIDIDGVVAKNTGNAIFIRLGHRNKDGKIGQLKNIRIANVKAEIPLRKPDLGYPIEGPPDYLRFRYGKDTPRPTKWPYNLIPSSIIGLPGHHIKNVVLENIEIVFEGAADKNLAHIPMNSLHLVPEKENSYPEFSVFGELPAWGFYVRHANGITMKNVKLSYNRFDFRPALVFDDVKDISLEDIDIPTGKELPIIMLNNVNGTKFKNLKLPFAENEAIKRRNK